MSTTTTPTFDFAELKRAGEERDATAQLALYADDAAVTVVDRINTPGSPRVLRGREEIRAWIEDACERDITHSVQHRVQDETGAAYIQSCRYPDGTKVLCATVLELDGGAIASQTVVQVWDEE
jgi:ketosteroid isomerase-like protein